MKTTWKDTPLPQKLVTVFSIVLGMAVVVLAFLQILDIWSRAVDLCIPLMGVNLLCQAYMQWNANRKSAYVSLCCGALVFICAVAVFCIG